MKFFSAAHRHVLRSAQKCTPQNCADLRTKIFPDVCEENKTLQEELQRLKQLRTPRKTINSPQQYSPKRPNKRLKLREKLPDEVAASAARVRILQDYLQPNCVNVYIQLLLFPLIV